MRRTMLKSKIHRATITGSDLHYVGSITIDQDLLDAADIREHEQVHVVDVDNGARFETYTISGERGSGEICVNGAAARLVHHGDTIIVIWYAGVCLTKRHTPRPARPVWGGGRRRRPPRPAHPAERLPRIATGRAPRAQARRRSRETRLHGSQ